MLTKSQSQILRELLDALQQDTFDLALARVKDDKEAVDIAESMLNLTKLKAIRFIDSITIQRKGPVPQEIPTELQS